MKKGPPKESCVKKIELGLANPIFSRRISSIGGGADSMAINENTEGRHRHSCGAVTRPRGLSEK